MFPQGPSGNSIGFWFPSQRKLNFAKSENFSAILEDVLMDIMYELPDMENISECIITKETLSTKVPVLREAESASDSISEQGAF